MDPHTLIFYAISAGLSFSLSLVLMAFAHFQPGTLLARRFAVAILMLAVAFFVAGCGPLLPRWMTVIGTNVLLLSAGVMFYTAFAAYCAQRETSLDRLGWSVVALGALPFWYWGLIEPNGIYRSVVFSFSAAWINGRSAWLLLRSSAPHTRRLPVLALGGIFAVLTLWMFVRGVLLLGADPAPPELRGTNPTTWVTVFWYIVLVSLLTAITLWMEVNRLKANRSEHGQWPENAPTSVEPARGNLLLLWSTVLVLCLGIVSEVGIAYLALYEKESGQRKRNAELANNHSVEYTLQLLDRADLLLRATRGYYQRTGSLHESENYIASLGDKQNPIDNIYLTDANGQLLIPSNERKQRQNIGHQDDLDFHRQTPEDRLYIGAAQTGLVTGKKQFSLSRRVNHPNGSFAGIVIALLESEAFSSHYQQWITGNDGMATLVGTADRKIRARVPEPDASQWNVPLASPMWEALPASPESSYLGQSNIDGMSRQYFYKRVGDLPLVMVTGFSEADVRSGVSDRLQPIAFGVLFTVIAVLTLATILTNVIRRRDEQDQFMSMLSHELKTPLSVIRMTLGSAAIPDPLKQRISRAVTEMNAIVERCVQADRLQHGLVAASLTSCRVEEMLGDLQQACRTPERVLVEADTLPSCRTDPQLLAVILGNLLDNALKYSIASERVNIAARVATYKRQEHLCVTVENPPGQAGMPDPKQVFRKYYRSPGAQGKTGAGLGLHIAAGFARKIGGELRYRPTTHTVKFELWMPL